MSRLAEAVTREQVDSSLEERFRNLAARWRAETALTSSVMDLVMHPAYQEIIGMGPAVLPYVMAELQDHGGHWFWALRAISGENPTRAEDAGNIERMTQVWLKWGREHDHI